MTVYPQGGQTCVCGAELQRLGEERISKSPLDK